ncbi:DNA cytosine methyltransferase [Microterricola viridarii]|uniref:Cytosine-specific methyltransferase n=1 Tax=Microterricola viridarii TaxID=412690 RepID=A0A1H1TNN5_9MICO|nr:DNA (cytosine-5-)-methyltransferase [Microterricola viridarii]SDS61860.1 DNA (cytosine-5)-methyltransferase 1 [Microterricola viridarii]
MTYNMLGMFSGAGGLDLGFEQAGFKHVGSMDWDPWSVATLRTNRPAWHVDQADAREWEFNEEVDVLVGGPPCQGYSLGGLRKATDDRNDLYEQVLRVAKATRPRAIVIENVLNLRTLLHPETGRRFSDQIAFDLTELGYEVFHNVFRVDGFGVPQTRRRWIFVAFRGGAPAGYHLPLPGTNETVGPWLSDLGNGGGIGLPNHAPSWTFKSSVHTATGEPFDVDEPAVIARFSRTASDGNPIRRFDQPFPAVDTATVWGWAQGNVVAKKFDKDRLAGKHIRNPDATVKLWRVSASRLRTMTARELARLQTFPDDWEFIGGGALRDIQMQVGNAVPVEFARRVGDSVRTALEAQDENRAFLASDGASVPLVFPGWDPITA